jgi:hypothetical protein
VVLTGKKSGNDKVQKHVEDCIGWLNAYFTDVGHATYLHMPDICVVREMGKLPYWCVEFTFLIYIYIYMGVGGRFSKYIYVQWQ